MTFISDLQGQNTQIYPIVTIEPPDAKARDHYGVLDEECMFLSTNNVSLDHIHSSINVGEKRLKDIYFKPILLNIPSIKESIDIESRKFKISNVTLEISNARYNGARFTEILSSTSLINWKVSIQFVSHSAKLFSTIFNVQGYSSYDYASFYEMYNSLGFDGSAADYTQDKKDKMTQMVYQGVIKKLHHDDERVKLELEDLTEIEAHNEVPTSKLSDDIIVAEKFRGQTIPMVYGEVSKSPLVFSISNQELQVDAHPIEEQVHFTPMYNTFTGIYRSGLSCNIDGNWVWPSQYVMQQMAFENPNVGSSDVFEVTPELYLTQWTQSGEKINFNTSNPYFAFNTLQCGHWHKISSFDVFDFDGVKLQNQLGDINRHFMTDEVEETHFLFKYEYSDGPAFGIENIPDFSFMQLHFYLYPSFDFQGFYYRFVINDRLMPEEEKYIDTTYTSGGMVEQGHGYGLIEMEPSSWFGNTNWEDLNDIPAGLAHSYWDVTGQPSVGYASAQYKILPQYVELEGTFIISMKQWWELETTSTGYTALFEGGFWDAEVGALLMPEQIFKPSNKWYLNVKGRINQYEDSHPTDSVFGIVPPTNWYIFEAALLDETLVFPDGSIGWIEAMTSSQYLALEEGIWIINYWIDNYDYDMSEQWVHDSFIDFFWPWLGDIGFVPPSRLRNGIDIIYDILRSEVGDLKIDKAQYREARQSMQDWKFAFTVTKSVDSKTLIQKIAQSTKCTPCFRNDGTFSFNTIKDTYLATTDYNKAYSIEANEVISYSCSKTPAESIYQKVIINHNMDYHEGIYQSEVSFGDGSAVPYYGLEQDQNVLTIDSEYIKGNYTLFSSVSNGALLLAEYLYNKHKNNHLIIKLVLPVKYIHLNVGDVIKINKLIDEVLPFGIDYRQVQTPNNQIYFPLFIITSSNKTLTSVTLECTQLHNLGTLTDSEVADWNTQANSLPVTSSFSNSITTPPVITLNGSSSIQYFLEEWYDELGATAVDALDVELEVDIYQGNLPLGPITGLFLESGDYHVIYTAVDSEGNIGQATRQIEVATISTDQVTSLLIPPHSIAYVRLHQDEFYLPWHSLQLYGVMPNNRFSLPPCELLNLEDMGNGIISTYDGNHAINQDEVEIATVEDWYSIPESPYTPFKMTFSSTLEELYGTPNQAYYIQDQDKIDEEHDMNLWYVDMNGNPVVATAEYVAPSNVYVGLYNYSNRETQYNPIYPVEVLGLEVGVAYSQFLQLDGEEEEFPDAYMTGDINNDGVVNVLDIVSVVNIILGLGALGQQASYDNYEAWYFYYSPLAPVETIQLQWDSIDINNDDVIDILDVVQVVNIVIAQ